METIFKFPLEKQRKQVLSLPADAEILSIQIQGDDVCACVKLDTNKPERDRTILYFGTGNEITEGSMQHISTIQINGYVWHFFEQ